MRIEEINNIILSLLSNLDEVMMLVDVPVRINVVDPWCIKLWNEVIL